MPKPFPHPFNIGTDICRTSRIFKLIGLSAPAFTKFANRLLHPIELNREKERLWEAQRYIISHNYLNEQESFKTQLEGHINSTNVVSKVPFVSCGLSGCFFVDFQSLPRVSSMVLRLREWKASKGLQELETPWLEATKLARFDPNRISRAAIKLLLEQSLHKNSTEDVQQDAEDMTDEDNSALFNVDDCHKICDQPVEVKRDIQKFLAAVFEHNEMIITEDYAGNKIIPLRKPAEWIAGRFAAKEAIIKAHHHRRLTFHDIVISKQANNVDGGSRAPIAVIIGKGGRLEDGQEVKLSISHDGDYATATCLAHEEPSKVARPSNKSTESGIGADQAESKSLMRNLIKSLKEVYGVMSPPVTDVANESFIDKTNMSGLLPPSRTSKPSWVEFRSVPLDKQENNDEGNDAKQTVNFIHSPSEPPPRRNCKKTYIPGRPTYRFNPPPTPDPIREWQWDKVIILAPLDPETTIQELQANYFKDVEGVKEVSINHAIGGPGRGFVYFNTRKNAIKAQEKLDGMKLDDRIVWCTMSVEMKKSSHANQ